MTMRRIAANVVLAPEGRTEQGVVTIENGIVCSIMPLKEELPMTEWYVGTIIVKPDSEGKRRAYMDGNPLV